MIETPPQPPHAAEFALLAGFILLLIFEALLVPAAGRRTARDVQLLDTPAASQRAAQEAPPLPTPAP